MAVFLLGALIQQAKQIHSGGTSMAKPRKPAPPGFRWVFVPSFRHWRSGKLLHAVDYGYESWCFLVRA
jgi:hypothetical protein